jgi:hypothetical protein
MDSDVLTIPQRNTLAGFVVAADSEEGIAVESIDPGATVFVDTANSEYRLTVLSQSERTVLIRGGTFQDATPVVVQGATAGGNLLRAGWIGVGLRLELSAGSRRVVTSRVRSICVIQDPESVIQG